MKDIQFKIKNLKEMISNLEEEKHKNIFDSVLAIIDDMANSIEEMKYKQEYLEENVKYIDEDIIGLQDELFEEVSIEDLMEMEEEYVEINCKSCNKPLFIEKESLDNNKDIPCPFCNNEAI